MLSINNLSCDFGNFRLNNINLSVAKSSYHMLVGPCGSGKTLLLETIAGLHKPESGTIVLNGREIQDLYPEKRKVGIVYQDHQLFPHMSVRDNVLYGLRFVSSEEKKRSRETLDRLTSILELEELLNRMHPRELSGGERQKIALARSLLTQPELLLLDEPLASLDFPLRETVVKLLSRLRSELDIPILHVTHDHSEIWALGDSVTVISDGSIRQQGSRHQVFHHPKTPFVARFLGAENIIPVTLVPKKTGVFSVLIRDNPTFDTESPGLAAGRALLVIRPEHIRIALPDENSRLTGRIVSSSLRGAWIRTGIEALGTELTVVAPADALNSAVTVGKVVALSFDNKLVHIIQGEQEQ